MYKVYDSITQVPQEWNSLTKDNVYLKIQFLAHLEKTQNQNPKYYMFYDENNRLDSIVYMIYYPAFPFSMNLNSDFTLKMHMLYFPAPLSKPSFFIGKKTQKEVAKVLRKTPGFTMITNVGEDNIFDHLPKQKLYQVVYLDLAWKSFDDYIDSMRSNYRRSHRKTLSQTKELQVVVQKELDYDDRMYSMYEQVYNHSDVPLGKQSKEFFDFNEFITISLKLEGNPIGFASIIHNNDELIFTLVGIDYSYTVQFSIYQRLLLEIVRYGINMKFKRIDFGQTTYDAKLKLGCNYYDTFLQLSHRCRLIQFGTVLFKKKLLKKHYDLPDFRVFKDKEGEEDEDFID